jgi:hypothetical protein
MRRDAGAHGAGTQNRGFLDAMVHETPCRTDWNEWTGYKTSMPGSNIEKNWLRQITLDLYG